MKLSADRIIFFDKYVGKLIVEKYGLVFTLLADPERTVIETYDVWKEKKN